MSKSKRVNYIRCIQAISRKRGLKEYEYRAIYERVTGQSSLRAMSDRELARLVGELKKEESEGPKLGGITLCQKPQARKVRSLWLTLRDLGVLRDSSEHALLAYIKHQTATERMEWLDAVQFQFVIESLKKWIERVEAEQFQAEQKRAQQAAEDARIAQMTVLATCF